MDILKAEAFANQTGVVLDTFRFSDRFCTLELNPGEIPRLKRHLRDAVSGEINISDLMEKKFQSPAKNPKVRIESRVHVDNSASIRDRKSTRLNSSHANTSYAVFRLKKNNPRLQQGPARQLRGEDHG